MQEFHEWLAWSWPILIALLGFMLLLGRVYQQVQQLREDNKISNNKIIHAENSMTTNVKEFESKLKQYLFQLDGTLIYVCRKDCEKELKGMENVSKENKMEYMTKADHEQKCRIATWEMKETVGKMLDAKFEAFEISLFKQLKLNGFRHSEV